MKFARPVVLLLALAACANLERDTPTRGVLEKRVLHVSTQGDDSWSGQLAKPNRDRTDGPLASLTGARDALRRLRYQSGEAGPFRVLVHGGTYELADTFVLTPEDGAHLAPHAETVHDEVHVVYEAFEDEQAVISGGRRLVGWNVGDDGRWTLEIPEVARGDWTFEQLYVDGVRRSRPRWPEIGYVTIEDAKPLPGSGVFPNGFRFEPGALRPAWADVGDIDVLRFELWTMSRQRFSRIDPEQHVVDFQGLGPSAPAQYDVRPGRHRILVENVRELLKNPGEWYLDRKSALLTYLPMPGEDPASTEVVAPRLERLVDLGIARSNGPKANPSAAGSIGEPKFVEGIAFRGISFAYTSWTVPAKGWSFPQAEVGSSAAISAVNARDCAFEHCTVSHTGAWAIELGPGCKRDRIESCDLTDLGAGGIKIGEMALRDDDEEVASENTVRDCLIARGGRIQPAAVGVWIGQSHHDTVAHNDIADFDYTGISVGWTWGYGKSLAHHNLIEANRIAHIGQGVLSDLGGIYMLGVSPGTVLRGNVIHDVESFDYGGWGIYTDEGSTGILIEKNVVWNTKSASFHQHYGRENVLRNNVFALAREAQIMRTRAEDHLSFTFEKNIVYWRDGVLLGSNWSGDHYAFDDNVYWNAAGKPVDFAGASSEAWRKRGLDAHSIIADPRFVDPAHADFRLKPDSPAFALGIESIDASRAGRVGHPPEVEPAPRAFP